jgi:putative metallopeptidase DUF4344
MGRSASWHGDLARCVQFRAIVRLGLGISVFIASVLATGVAVAGTRLPATATVTSAVRSMFRGSYEPPTDSEHDAVYEDLKAKQILEKLSDALAAIRLKRPLLMRFAGCDGTSNAWYDDEEGSITFCYEYVADLERSAREAAFHGIQPDVARDGAVAFVLLHEISHALFHRLNVPILGREEDAADQLAAFMLLRAGEGIARRILTGAAWMYLHDAAGRMPDESDFSDVHGLDAQRFYNVLCMAHGSNPAAFQAMVDKGYLPKDRAESCAEEYRQVAYATRKLIDRSLDPQMWARTREKNKGRWEKPEANSPRASWHGELRIVSPDLVRVLWAPDQ